MRTTIVTATTLLLGLSMSMPASGKSSWNYTGHITAVDATSITVFDKQRQEHHTVAFDSHTAITRWIRERPYVRPVQTLTPEALQYGGLVRVRLGEGAATIADAIEVASDVKTTFSGRVKAFDETTLSVYNDDMGVATLHYGTGTAFRRLFTEKPWVRGPVPLSAGDLRVGDYVIMHSPEPGALTADRVEIARDTPTSRSAQSETCCSTCR